MDMFLLVFVLGSCLYLGVKTIISEERNKVFTKFPIEVTDVKKYNQYCGILIIAFGVLAEITLWLMIITGGWVSILLLVLMIAEAYAVVRVYNKIEKKFLKKR